MKIISKFVVISLILLTFTSSIFAFERIAKRRKRRSSRNTARTDTIDNGAIEYSALKDIRYFSEDPLNKLDIYTPESDTLKMLPVIAYVHGGAWSLGDKKNVSLKPQFFIENGFIFVSINYRLSPDILHPIHTQDVAEAIAWVYDNIEKYQGNKSQIFLMGHSASAHLVSLVALDTGYLGKKNLTPQIIRGVIALDSGFYDISRRLEMDSKQKPKKIISQAFGNDQLILEDASPNTHIGDFSYIPPFFIAYCAHREISKDQSQYFASNIRLKGTNVSLFAAENETHESINKGFGERDDSTTKSVLDWLKYYLK